MTKFGVHTGLQHTTADELRPLWKRIEELGFDWISIWDHFYGATGQPDDAACLEAVAMHAALACETERVECGSLVYSIGYRHPAVLAKAITAIDLLSGGRAAMGIGAGWAEVEYNAYGIPFPTVGTRMDQLEEGIAVPARPAARRGHRLRGRVVPADRRPQRAPPGAGQAADLDRRRRREADAADRRPVRRRLERAVRVARSSSPPSATCCTATAPTSGATRPRSDAPSTSAWRGPRRACSGSSARSPTCVRPGVLDRLVRRGRRPHRPSTSRPAPTRSTSRCGRRSTSTSLEQFSSTR